MMPGLFYQVFLSHHTADQSVVEAVARRLRAANLAPFLDRWHLIPGDPWMEAIEEALASSETVAVFVGPSGIGPWQNEEMRAALYDSAVRGKRVIPVLLPGADPQRVSPFLTRRTWVDFRAGPEDADALQRLIAGIQGLPSEAGGYLSPLDLAAPQYYFTPFQAPPLPPYFVPRPEAAEAIRAALLDARSDTPGVLTISAIHGLGGIGKTTLIAALAYDPAIRQRYPDGILWATLGQQSELFPRLLEWIQQLGDYTFKPTTLEGASSHLRTLLIDKACLLVVDDAWQREHVDPFLVGGPRSQVVITTRDATLARKLRARLHDLDVMTESQALALFEGRLGALFTSNWRDQAAVLAKELGYLPLAVELAAAQVESGRSCTELLAHFQSALADLIILDLDEATRRDESLRVSFALSLDSLAEEDRNAFVWFGILPEDAIIGPTMVATLWDESKAQARERLRRLRHKALLKPVGDERYTLHDLLHAEAKSRLAQQISLPKAHVVLLARYAVQCKPVTQTEHDSPVLQTSDFPIANPRPLSSVLWHTLPDDGYVHAHLTWHMQQAGEIERIHAILQEVTADGCNGWYSALERLGQIATFVNDLISAWKLADVATSIALQCRYALALTSLNTVAANIPDKLLTQLVHSKIWPPAQALAYVQQIPVERRRCEALSAIVPYLSPDLLTQAMDAAMTVQAEGLRLVVFASLVSHLHETQQKNAFEMAQAFHNNWSRCQAFMALAPFLDEPQRRRALARARVAAVTIEDGGERSEALASLSLHLSKPERQLVLADALGAAQTILDIRDRTYALIDLVPSLDESQRTQALDEALKAAQAMHDEADRSGALKSLAPHLNNRQRQQALEAALGISDETHKSYALQFLAPYLNESQRQQALRSAQTIENEWARSSVLAALVPLMTGTQRQRALAEAMEAVMAIQHEPTRSGALICLAPILSGLERQQALQAALALGDERDRSEVLSALAPHLNAPQRQKALESALAIQADLAQAIVLTALAPHLNAQQRHQVLEAAQAIHDWWHRLSVLASLVPHLTQTQFHQVLSDALMSALAIKDERNRIQALATLAPNLDEAQRQHALKAALKAAQTIQDGRERLETLGLLARHLKEPQRQQLLMDILQALVNLHSMFYINHYQVDRSQALSNLTPYLTEQQRQLALNAASTIRDEWAQSEALADLAPYLNERQRQRALEAAQAIEDGLDRSRALSALAGFLNPCQRHHVMAEALVAAQTIKDEEYRFEALATLAPHLTEPEYHQALEVAQSLQGNYYRSQALAALVPRLGQEQRQHALTTALDAALAIQDQEDRSEALAALASQLNGPQRIVAMRAALAILDEWSRCKALVALAPHMNEPLRQQALAYALEATTAIQDIPTQYRALAYVAPNLSGQHRQQALDDTLGAAEAIRSSENQSAILMALAPYLNEVQLHQALETARAIQYKDSRSEALAALAHHLAPLPSETLTTVWSTTLHTLASRTRADLLIDLCALTPIIETLSTPDDMAEIAQAIIDVGRWWP